MKAKVKDFIAKWSGDFRIEDKNGSIYGEFRENLTEELLNKEISDIKLERTMWTDKCGDIVIIIE